MASASSINRQEYLVALGRIAVNMNALEMWARTSLLLILGRETGGFVMALLSTENFARVMNVLRFAFRYKVSDETRLNRFDTVCQKLDELYAERNRYLHSVWLFAQDDSFVVRMKNRKWPFIEHDAQPDAPTLNRLADELGTAHQDLLDLVNEVFPSSLATPTNA